MLVNIKSTDFLDLFLRAPFNPEQSLLIIGGHDAPILTQIAIRTFASKIFPKSIFLISKIFEEFFLFLKKLEDSYLTTKSPGQKSCSFMCNAGTSATELTDSTVPHCHCTCTLGMFF